MLWWKLWLVWSIMTRNWISQLRDAKVCQNCQQTQMMTLTLNTKRLLKWDTIIIIMEVVIITTPTILTISRTVIRRITTIKANGGNKKMISESLSSWVVKKIRSRKATLVTLLILTRKWLLQTKRFLVTLLMAWIRLVLLVHSTIPPQWVNTLRTLNLLEVVINF